MEKNKELELDIQYVKSVLDKYLCLCKDITIRFEKTDKVINSRKNFIIFQFRNIFDFGFWF